MFKSVQSSPVDIVRIAISFDQAIRKISSKQKKIICAFGSLYNCGNILNKN